MDDGSRYLALDLLQIKSGTHFSECAIVLEIWPSGASFQTANSLLAGSQLEICLESGPVTATVDSCRADLYGFVISVTVSIPRWFPTLYRPAHLLPTERASAASATGNQNTAPLDPKGPRGS